MTVMTCVSANDDENWIERMWDTQIQCTLRLAAE